MTNVVCIKQGKLYGPHYVNILHASLRRHATLDFRFVCFTEDRDGLDPAIEARPLPYWLRGWWNKIPLFAPPQCIENDQIIAIDLDVVITGSIDWLLNFRADFCGYKMIARSEPTYNGSLWTLKPGCYQNVWFNFQECADEIMSGNYSDQEWISQQIKDGKYFQDWFPRKVAGYRADYLEKGKGVPDKETSIWLFHGFPKPLEAAKTVGWIKENWRI